MIKHILNEIVNDLKGQITLEEIKNLDKIWLDLGVCRYIRNKYLWKNPQNVKMFQEFFNVEHVDDISFAILEYAKKFLD